MYLYIGVYKQMILSAENTSLLIIRLLRYESRTWNILGNSVSLVETMVPMIERNYSFMPFQNKY